MRGLPRSIVPLDTWGIPWGWGYDTLEHTWTILLALTAAAIALHVRAALRDWEPGEYDDWDNDLGN